MSVFQRCSTTCWVPLWVGKWIPRQQQPPGQHSSVSWVQGSRRKLVQTFFIRSEIRLSARGWWLLVLVGGTESVAQWLLEELWPWASVSPWGWPITCQFRKIVEINFHMLHTWLTSSSFSRCSPTTQVLLRPVPRGFWGGFAPTWFYGTGNFLLFFSFFLIPSSGIFFFLFFISSYSLEFFLFLFLPFFFSSSSSF